MNTVQYPIFSRMARDYLAIQGSAVPSERAFSGGGITDTERRNRLATATFEALQILKAAYSNGTIVTTEIKAALGGELTQEEKDWLMSDLNKLKWGEDLESS